MILSNQLNMMYNGKKKNLKKSKKTDTINGINENDFENENLT